LGTEPVALVTGGTRRIGAHLAGALAARGYRLVLVYRSDAAAAEATAGALRSRGARVRLTQADVADAAAVKALFESVAQDEGRLDVLVHNVGVYHPASALETTPQAWDAQLKPNLMGGFYCAHHAAPLLMKQGGLMVFLGFAGVDALRANPLATAYQVSKTGLLVLVKSLAVSLAPHRVRVNMLSPGQMENSVDLEEDAGALPMGRPGRLDELAHALGFLLEAEYVTGMNLDVAGGHRL
jgi:NAD(P)-dependent dehydrogenase (short-subunit alcohol dehydrogenase family)